ncbi:MAG: DJ-1/PfpI family protein [Deltaproteobacteria bacterium]|nr:DJ-1/PfpI family protein [Deltaproteobacteria bacterium]MBZ0219510.1 DJ-1/PfpI family protein [Deltaproteobacteria bacterium]
MARVLVPIAPGFEEIEAVTIVDILRRAGAHVVMAGTVPGPVEGRSGIRVLTDALMDDVGADYEMIVLPGGALGAENLKKDARVSKLITVLMDRGRKVAAICAAPTVLSAHGATSGKRITSHPSVREELLSRNELVSDERVVADGNIITSQGPGTAMEFAFRLVETLFGKTKAEEVNKGVLARL